MSKIYPLLSVVTFVMTSACKTTQYNQTGLKNSEIKNIVCSEGEELQRFKLAASDFSPQVTDIDIPSKNGDLIIKFPVDKSTIRLDVCLKVDDPEAAPIPKQIVSAGWAGLSEIQVYEISPEDILVNKGLGQAFFGNASDLLLEIKYETESDPSPETKLQLKGWKKGDKTFVTFAKLERFSSDQEFNIDFFRTVLAGKLEPGDPFTADKCEYGQWPKTSNFTIGTANFEIEHCNWPGTGETTNYSVSKVILTDPAASADKVIIDSDKILSFPEGGGGNGPNNQRICLPEKEACFSVHHHDWCDSFEIRYKENVYKMTSASASFGCRMPDFGAPLIPKIPNPKPGEPYVPFEPACKYQIIRGSQPPESGDLKQGHYLQLW